MKLSHLMIGAAAAASLSSAANAVNLTFPGVGADWISQGNADSGTLTGGDATNYMWVTDDYVRQTFTDTGLASATSADGRVTIENVLGATDLLVDFLVNGITVGQFTIAACNFCFEIQEISYSFDFSAIAGDDYDIEFRLANTIPDGDGSVRWFEGGLLILEGEAVIPEPASWALMIAGFGLVGGAMRRRIPALAA